VLRAVLHGVLIALAGGFAVALVWLPRRRELVGLAAASAAVLIAVLICAGYYSFTYLLWLAPLVLAALLLDGSPAAAGPIAAATRLRAAPAQRRSGSREQRRREPVGAGAQGAGQA
jgi:hypothetical protein